MKILGANFQRAREELGLTVEEVANQSTLSKKQVLQIETGESDAFYTQAILLRSARKVACILGMNESAAFEVPGDRCAELDLVAEGSADQVKLASSCIEAKGEIGPSNPIRWKFLNVLTSLLMLLGLAYIFYQQQLLIKLKTDIATCLANTSEAIKEPEALELASPKVVAQQPILEQAPPPRADTNFQCAHQSAPILEYQAPRASKTGNVVYILNRGVAELICLEDSNGNNQRRWLLENEGVSFKGNPPFKAISNNLKQFDIYYQGYKVQPALLDRGVLLKEVEVN